MPRIKGFKHSKEAKEKISLSQKGNTNTTIYSEDDCNKILDTCIEMSKQKEPTDDSVYKFDFIGTILSEVGLYYRLLDEFIERYPYLKAKYSMLKQQMEINCYENSKRNKINPTIGLANLRANHKWTDRQDMTSGDKPLSISTVLDSLEK